MWRRLGSLLLAVATFGASWTMGMAVADPPEPRLILSDVGSTSATPITIEKMYPGLAVTQPYAVGLTSTAPDAELTLEVTNLVDLERDCNHPETTSGDASCGEFDGELSEQLLLSAELAATDDCDDTSASTVVLAPTALADVAAGNRLDLASIASGETRCLLLTFDLPWAADNRTQTDLAQFDLTVVAEQVVPTGDPQGASNPSGGGTTNNPGGAVVAGRNTSRGEATAAPTDEPETRVLGTSAEHVAPTTRVLGVQLSATGAQVALLVALALGGIGGGGLVLLLSRRREQARRPA